MSTVSDTSKTAAESVLADLSRKKDETSKTEDSQTRFLTLLTAQLKNQDPMDPMDNAQVTSQLAQISTVDGIERLNIMLGKIMEGQQSSEALQAAELVGRGVLVPGKGLLLTDQGAVGGFALDTPADKVTLSIRDANGLDIAEIDLGAFDTGTHNFQWDGTSMDGSRAADGKYAVTISAATAGEPVNAEMLEFGAVTSVVRGPKSIDLQLGDMGIFKMSDIRQIL
jgi:flagellar basal-body rod modification protein FlgD